MNGKNALAETQRSQRTTRLPHRFLCVLCVSARDSFFQIDRLVYDLYGLTDDEIKLVEEATA